MKIDRRTVVELLRADFESAGVQPAEALHSFPKRPTNDEILSLSALLQLNAIVDKARTSAPLPPKWQRDAALQSLITREGKNRLLNDRIRADLVGPHGTDLLSVTSEYYYCDRDFQKLLDEAAAIVAGLLPPVGLVEEEIWGGCKFGPGSTFRADPEGYHLLTKISGDPTSTLSAARLACDILPTYYPALWDTWKGKRLQLVRGSRVSFVSKDAEKCRTIAIEPTVNMFLQLGAGNFIAKQLRKVGIDIRSQNRNQLLAKLGSTLGNYATLDLSDASNSISTWIVRRLLPPDWFELLEGLRANRWFMDGKWEEMAMFSSMGNGFTFPLETLIFYAITRAASGTFAACYGDDIVCHTKDAKRVIAALTDCGFSVNESKSFIGGYYRESCGSDFIDGVNVRPVFLYEDTDTHSDVASFHNRLWRRWGDTIPRTLSYLKSCVPETKRLEGPPRFWSDSRQPDLRDPEVLTADSGREVKHNRVVDVDRWWFINPDYGYTPVWDPDLQGNVVKLRAWVSRSLQFETKKTINDGEILRAYLYAGRDPFATSKLTKNGVTDKFLPYRMALLP